MKFRSNPEIEKVTAVMSQFGDLMIRCNGASPR